MSKLALLAALPAVVASGCTPVPSSSAPTAPPMLFAGQTEGLGAPREAHGALSLSYRHLFDMPPKVARTIDRIDLFLGKARLRDGRCLMPQYAIQTRLFTGAILSSDRSACGSLVEYPLLVSARCAADQNNVTIGPWRVGCRVIGRGRSVIVATRRDDPSSTLELASLPDEELLAVGVMGLHDQGIVRTIGIRRDGKVALSDYLWFNGPYHAAATGR